MQSNYILRLITCAIFISCLACSSQAPAPSSTMIEAASPEAANAKLIKTQGAKEWENINSSLQDKEGNLWFGTTAEGVYRYDGESFRQFTVAEGLSSNTTWSLFEDKAGRIWVGTSEGLNYFARDTILKIKVQAPGEPAFEKNDILDITQDRNGKLWFSTINGVYTYDGSTFSPFTINETSAGGYRSDRHNVEYMLEDKAGNMWFGGRTNAGVYRFDGENIIQFKLEPLSDHDWAWPLLQDKNGDIWFSNWGGVYRYDGSLFTSITKNDGLCSPVVTQIIEDQHDNLWFGGGEGICRYDGTTFTAFPVKERLANKGTWSILEDQDGILWIGMRNTDLYRFDGKAFSRYSEKRTALPSFN